MKKHLPLLLGKGFRNACVRLALKEGVLVAESFVLRTPLSFVDFPRSLGTRCPRKWENILPPRFARGVA